MDEMTRQQDNAAEELALEYTSVEVMARDAISLPGQTLFHVRGHERFTNGETREFVIDEEGATRLSWVER